MEFHGPSMETPWKSMEFHGTPWSSMDPPWNSMEFHGPSMELHGVPWIIHGNPMELHGVPWNSMDFHGIPWNSVEFHGIPWTSMGLFDTGAHDIMTSVTGSDISLPWQRAKIRLWALKDQITIALMKHNNFFV